MAQEIIVYVIGAAVAVYIAIAVYRVVSGRKNPCAGCSGCDLRDEFRKKQAECGKDRSLRNPKCGGKQCGCGK